MMATVELGLVLQELYEAMLVLLAVTGRLLAAQGFANLPPQPLNCLVSPFSIAKRNIDVEDA